MAPALTLDPPELDDLAIHWIVGHWLHVLLDVLAFFVLDNERQTHLEERIHFSDEEQLQVGVVSLQVTQFSRRYQSILGKSSFG